MSECTEGKGNGAMEHPVDRELRLARERHPVAGHWCYTLRVTVSACVDVCAECGAVFPPLDEPQPEPVWKP